MAKAENPSLGAEIVAIQKTSSVAYLQAVFAVWRDRAVAMPAEQADSAALPGYAIARRIAVADADADGGGGGGWFDEGFAPDDDPAPAQISFTSGTTGDPKPILLSRRAISDVSERLIDVMRMDGTIREYIGVPVTFSFGLGRARAVAAVGGRSYLPHNGFRTDELARMIADGEVNALSAVPTLLRALILQREAFDGIGANLRWLEIGSQSMSAEEKAAIRAIFPRARIVQHYGLTEASRTTFLAIDEAGPATLDTVGRPTGAAEVRIDSDGRIAIRGPHVASGVLRSGQVIPLTDAEGWLRTSDLGTIDADGFVHFIGRADHVLNVGGIKVSAELFEQRLVDRLGADGTRIAVAARGDPLRGEAVMVAHLPGVDGRRLGDEARAVAAAMGLGAADVGLVEVAEIPRTETGKVRRADLTATYGSIPATAPDGGGDNGGGSGGGSGGGAGAEGANAPRAGREQEIAAIWHEALGVSPIGRDESFFDLGGDSLSAISVMLRMERAGVPKTVTQKIFEGRTIAEIAADADGTAVPRAPALRAVTNEAINFTRGLLVLLVLAAHWSPFVLERMGQVGRAVTEWTWPLFRMGTPGFAMIFGVGLGYFLLPVAKTRPARLGARLRVSFLIVAAGVIVTALLIAMATWLTEGALGPLWPTRIFYGVLTAYLLLIAAAGPILRAIGRVRYPMLVALLAMVASFAAAELVRPLLDPDSAGAVHLATRLLAANYGFPVMLAYVLIGLAMGLWIERNNDRDDLARVTGWAGSVLFFGGIVLSFGAGIQDRWFFGLPTQPAIMTYAGAVLLTFATAFHFLRHGRARQQPLCRLAVVTGILALPAYVGHGAVGPLKEILVAMGLPYGTGPALAMLLFVAPFGVAMQRVYRRYYG